MKDYSNLLKHTFIDYTQTSKILESPLIFTKGEGLYLWDINGKKYFDAIGGIFVACLGHRHPKVMEAMIKQMEKLTFAPPLHGISDIALEFVEKIGSITPGNLNYVKGFSGGSESIEAALKFVRQYYKQTNRAEKYKFISNYLSYHGATFGAMAAGGGNRKVYFEPQMAGFLKILTPMQLRERFSSWEETNRFCAQMFEDVIIAEDPRTIAAVILEPISMTGQVFTPTDEYFQIIKKTCEKYDITLIFDEVLIGIGKTGDMFAAETFKVIPDIICSGKALSSGAIPIGSMMAREDFADAFYGAPGLEFAHGHTFANNPLTSAAGIAVINELLEQKLPEKGREKGTYLVKKLEEIKDKYGVIREIRGKAMLQGVELVQNIKTLKPFPASNSLGAALKKTALDNGLILRISSNPDWFAVAPPLIAEKSDIDEMCDLIDKSLKEALNIVFKAS
jgi:adenosylmethionine-8-amino-7-oxononanoate aminotransferase